MGIADRGYVTRGGAVVPMSMRDSSESTQKNDSIDIGQRFICNYRKRDVRQGPTLSVRFVLTSVEYTSLHYEYETATF